VKTTTLLLALLLAGCKAEIATNEQADVEITKLLDQYRAAVFDGKNEKAAEVENEVNELIAQWRDTTTTCSVLSFKRHAQQQLVFLIPFDSLMHRKPSLTAEQKQSELSDKYSLLNRSSAAPNAIDKEIESCISLYKHRYTPAEMASIKEAYKPLQKIYSTARTYFPSEMWRVAENTDEQALNQARTRLQVEQARDREVADCVTAATADPDATAQVTKNEITAACRTMLR
jgi:hypothetical protein